jgi:hypothetical protein
LAMRTNSIIFGSLIEPFLLMSCCVKAISIHVINNI